jgi:repressor LexA
MSGVSERRERAHRASRSGEHSLGAVLRVLRRRSGLSLAELAARAACSQSYLSSIENGKRPAPRRALLETLERCLDAEPGVLVRVADRERAPDSVLSELADAKAQAAMLARLRDLCAGGGLEEAHRAGLVQKLLDELGGLPADGASGGNAGIARTDLPVEVPLINKVTAGYPTEFTDLGYPARVADDYVRCPDLRDPDAFAARVVGDSMAPDYREGDIVVFSPMRDIADGDDCFARLATGDESTFKRVYFERDGDRERIRLQPINSRYAPRTYDRDEVAGLYRAVQVMRAV